MADDLEEGTEKSKSSKFRIVIAALVLIVAGELAFRAYNHFTAGRSTADAASGQPEAKGNAAASATKAKKTEVKSTLILEPFLVNLVDKDDVRFLKVTFHLGLEEASGEASKNPVALAEMRDTIISILSSKTSAEILTPEGKNKLRGEIRDRVNAVAPKTKVQEVFIVEFVVQL